MKIKLNISNINYQQKVKCHPIIQCIIIKINIRKERGKKLIYIYLFLISFN